MSGTRLWTPDAQQLGVQGTHGIRGKWSELLSELADLLLQLVQLGGLIRR